MKSLVFDSSGKSKESKAPEFFDSKVREDIVAKAVESARFEVAQPYSLYEEAGRRHAASGKISHQRHKWKGHYGKGVSRIPRKTMWRRGTQFYWIGTEVSGTRGGRRVHGPTLFKRARKVNKRELNLAMKSALAATAQEEFISKRYATLKGISGVHIINQIPEKTKDFVSLIKKMFNTEVAIPRVTSTRAGKGKMRGRRTKSTAGALFIISESEKSNFKHIETRTTKNLSILDLYPLGRLTIFTEKALEELKNVI